MEERRAARYPYLGPQASYPAYPEFQMNQPVQHYYSQEQAPVQRPPAYQQPFEQNVDPFSAYQQPVHQPVQQHMQPFHPFPYPNPYPSPRPNLHQPAQFQSFLSQFKKKNGQLDFSKMMDTAGQMMSTVNQVGSLAKGFIGFFK
ncbi:YppG family protein [Bacillus swezeyi]|uniref:Spore coat protein n=1 Tax=Bacillus swezeyi TaxID=1925020 RepID=A0A1R1S2U2_9BACI|nr:YppG family protein [Bacillus swezeyi]MEC1260576.1 YppG family protein [Bacillus swezeyi]MED1740991.1 YppG family protein [Bacillus swezeyi]MED2929679.1 YppG family protein [Bacillus swezeyi]MED2943572.1 YppG family protein [Bacillus swezeyi]MED2963294.1 YppG family protein [Bacillus swezeyi]